MAEEPDRNLLHPVPAEKDHEQRNEEQARLLQEAIERLREQRQRHSSGEKSPKNYDARADKGK